MWGGSSGDIRSVNQYEVCRFYEILYIKILFLRINYVYFMCMCSVYKSGGLRGLERAQHPLELAFQMAVMCHMGVGLEPRSFRRKVSALHHQDIYLAPGYYF